MAQKVFGPVRGAGVQIIELEGDKPIEPAALGQVAYAGLFEKGTIGDLIQNPNKSSFLKRMGSYIEDGFAPDAAIDFFDIAAGAGAIWAVRVTDGNEATSSLQINARRTLTTPVGTVAAKNAGRWGGKEKNFTADFALVTDLTEITLDTGLATFETDEWKGGFVELDAVTNKRYPIVGNTAAGVITVEADQTMAADLAASGSPTNFRYYLVLENVDDQGDEKAVSILIGDGEENTSTEFSLTVFVDGAEVIKYPNLSTDPTSPRYWVTTINDFGGNDEIFATDLFLGQHLADVRPANYYGEILTVTATVLNRVLTDFVISSPSGGDPTFLLGTTDEDMLEQKITITMTSATSGTAASDRFGDLGVVTLGVLFAPNNKWTPPFTVTAGGSPLVATDLLFINYKPFKSNELVGGFLYPDKVNAPLVKFRIVSNDHDSIIVADGSDMTVDAAPTDEFLVEIPRQLRGGRDGHADIVDSDFSAQAWDVSLSPFNKLEGKNLGLVKMATPGVTSVAVQKSGVAYAAAKNYQYRYEAPDNIVTEAGVDDFVNSQLGRNDYAVISFPSFGDIADPLGSPGLRREPLTGQIHGREAAIARNFDGYHKAAAGIDAILSKVLALPTDGNPAPLDEEFLNPLGINVIKKIKGNAVLWGDRTLFLDPAFKFKHQRELLSHYEHTLQEAFDFIIFAINDPVTEKIALTSLKSFFLPEFKKRAIRGNTFDEAAIIKIDAENNTNATRAAGDLFADILLRLADTVERFRIRIGKQGIFESAA